MLDWIVSNIATIVICAALVALVVLVIATLMREKKQGKSLCGGSCGSCPMGGHCHGGTPSDKSPSEDTPDRKEADQA